MSKNLKNHINQLILKSFKSKAADEEYAQIDQWAKESEENLDKLKELKSIWNSSENIHEYRSFDVKEGWDSIDKKMSTTKRNRFSWVYSAAAIGAILVASYFLFSTNDAPSDISNVYATQLLNQQIQLEDKSNIWLKSESSLSKVSSFIDERVVSLQGEAYFDIYRDEKRQFIIKAGKETITVLGTKFLVVNDKDNFEVIVESGLVEVNTGKRKIQLSRNDQLVKQNGDYIKMKTINNNRFDWIGDELYFENASLSKVLLALSEKFDIHFSNPNGVNLTRCKITSNYHAESLDEIIDELNLLIGLEVKKSKSNKYSIEAVNCK